MLLAVILYYLRPRIRLVAENGSARQAGKFINNFLRKSVRKDGKRVRRINAGNFPVTDCRVLACGTLLNSGIRADRSFIFRITLAADAVDIEKSELFHCVERKVFGFHKRAESVRAFIAEGCRVLCSADTEAVKHYKKNSLHKKPSFTLFISQIISFDNNIKKY